MTWAIGRHNGGKDAILVGDTRAMWRGNDRVFDHLRTVHLVGSGMAVAYSGSVHTGLALVRDLQRFRREAVSQHAGKPDRVLQCWTKRAQQTFARIGPHERVPGARLLVVAASGSERSGWTLEGPRFDAKPLTREQWSIVAGNDIAARTVDRLLLAAGNATRLDDAAVVEIASALAAVERDGAASRPTPILAVQLSRGEQKAPSLHHPSDEADAASLVGSWKQFKSKFGTAVAVLAEC